MRSLSSAQTPTTRLKTIAAALFSCTLLFGQSAWADQNANLAPGFSTIAKNTKVVVMPVDIELFALTAGGVNEPKADWTEAASSNFRKAIAEKKRALGLGGAELSEADADAFAQVNSLHAAVARAIASHHFGLRELKLPTKNGELNWSLGDAVKELKQKTGADYALFSWVRDSYATGGRKATFVLLAAVGVGIQLGQQVGYASLVDLKTGQVVWFNRLARPAGDLREVESAKNVLDSLLTNFPATL